MRSRAGPGCIQTRRTAQTRLVVLPGLVQ